jgi:50S ribosomal subunit-associated GTPase HflX
MNHQHLENAMQEPIKHMPTEADVGSGEKGPGEQETDEMIKQVGDKVEETRRQSEQQKE